MNLQQTVFEALPLGGIKPAGWLKKTSSVSRRTD